MTAWICSSLTRKSLRIWTSQLQESNNRKSRTALQISKLTQKGPLSSERVKRHQLAIRRSLTESRLIARSVKRLCFSSRIEVTARTDARKVWLTHWIMRIDKWLSESWLLTMNGFLVRRKVTKVKRLKSHSMSRSFSLIRHHTTIETRLHVLPLTKTLKWRRTSEKKVDCILLVIKSKAWLFKILKTWRRSKSRTS